MNTRIGVLCLGLLALAACDVGSAAPAADAGMNDPQGGSSASGGTSGTAGTGATGAVPEPGLLYIQEDELGFSAVDGKVLPREGSTSITGYTGTGFADGDPGIGTAISWSVNADSEGPRSLVWRYAFGGAAENLRDARLLVNGTEIEPMLAFAYTNTWNDWQETPPLEMAFDQGPSFIQLVAIGEGGLANVDYLLVQGEGITPAAPSFTVSVTANDESAGSVMVDPQLDFYPQGTEVTITAEAESGHFFQSLTGDVTSATAQTTFTVEQNTRVVARFLPDGAEQDPELVGYATVQDDEGTPYLVTGGSLGEEVTATTLEELAMYLESPDPYVVSFSGEFAGADAIHVASDKTLVGVGDTAHLVGIELEIAGRRNVIIRNVAVSHVVAEGSGTANDAIVISDSKNVWIDHCELFSDRLTGTEYYDGLFEIKNGAAFITVSHTVFRDHFKVSLISSGDEQVGDTVIRATYHHNHFHDVESRLPSIRFGRAHIFNNYFFENYGGSGVNSRMGAIVKVEANYFQNIDQPIGSWDSPDVGTWDVLDNVFDACSGAQPTTSTGTLAIPYEYALDDPAELPTSVPAAAGVGR